MSISIILMILISVVFIAWVFRPKKGFLDGRLTKNKNQQKDIIEDILKYLYSCELKNEFPDKQSVTKYLSNNETETGDLIESLEKMGFINFNDNHINLNDEGRSYALKIIRVHRLIEKYLADETSVEEKNWHLIAEQEEHNLTDAQIEDLAAQLSNPLFDPHGDPIPTADGEIPPVEAISLTELKNGEVGIITHIEDEPIIVYQQLIAENLYPGKQIRMLEQNNERIKFIANDEECILAPVFAENLQVRRIERKEEIRENFSKLSKLRLGEKAIVTGISEKCRGQQRRRLMDLGIIPGAEITVEMESFRSDPIAYLIKGTIIALRNDQADLIFIEEAAEGEK